MATKDEKRLAEINALMEELMPASINASIKYMTQVRDTYALSKPYAERFRDPISTMVNLINNPVQIMMNLSTLADFEDRGVAIPPAFIKYAHSSVDEAREVIAKTVTKELLDDARAELQLAVRADKRDEALGHLQVISDYCDNLRQKENALGIRIEQLMKSLTPSLPDH